MKIVEPWTVTWKSLNHEMWFENPWILNCDWKIPEPWTVSWRSLSHELWLQNPWAMHCDLKVPEPCTVTWRSKSHALWPEDLRAMHCDCTIYRWEWSITKPQHCVTTWLRKSQQFSSVDHWSTHLWQKESRGWSGLDEQGSQFSTHFHSCHFLGNTTEDSQWQYLPALWIRHALVSLSPIPAPFILHPLSQPLTSLSNSLFHSWFVFTLMNKGIVLKYHRAFHTGNSADWTLCSFSPNVFLYIVSFLSLSFKFFFF